MIFATYIIVALLIAWFIAGEDIPFETTMLKYTGIVVLCLTWPLCVPAFLDHAHRQLRGKNGKD